MAETRERPANVLPLPRWTLVLHGAQLVAAVIVLGLASFGVHYIAYNALIFAIVCCVLTFFICGYILGSTLFLQNLYNAYAVGGLHILMVIFWIVAMGLVANLARIWGAINSLSSSYGYYYNWYKRDLSHSGLQKRDTMITIKTYWSVLTAAALFSAAELALWAASTALVLIYLNKHRANSRNNTTQQPPAYTGNAPAAQGQEKYGQTGTPQQPAPVYQQPQQQQQQQYYQQPQQSQSSVPTPQQQYAQPYQQGQMPYGQQPMYNQQQQQTTPYPQDPVNRTGTVSPVSQAGPGGPPANASELASPQQQGANYTYPTNASELSTPQQNANYNPNASELSSYR